MRPKSHLFYGWWMVVACFVMATVSWSLGVFGAGVYLHTISALHGWPISAISVGGTIFYLVSAAFSIPVARAIVRFGPRPIYLAGAIALAAGVIGMGQIGEPWHVHLNFMVLGVSYACLGATAISTTLAPWFERHQGRAVSAALMGASAGGIVGAPLLIMGTASWGFTTTTLVAGIVSAITIVPIALLTLRQRPEDIGLYPDGDAPAAGSAIRPGRAWGLREAFQTSALLSVIVAFGIALSMQVGFLTHHVPLIAPHLGDTAASATVSATGLAGLCGRLLLSKFADQVELRTWTAGLLLLGAAAFGAMAFFPSSAVFIGASIAFGFTLGNITSLSPIIVRKEFGAVSFGAIYGVAGAIIGLVSALGPGIWGMIHYGFGGYGAALLVSALLDVIAAIFVFAGRRRLSL